MKTCSQCSRLCTKKKVANSKRDFSPRSLKTLPGLKKLEGASRTHNRNRVGHAVIQAVKYFDDVVSMT